MKLIEVIPKKDFQRFVRYDDGACGVIDLSSYAGKGVFAPWLQAGVFEQVGLAEAGHPEWPGEVDLCPDALDMQLIGIMGTPNPFVFAIPPIRDRGSP